MSRFPDFSAEREYLAALPNVEILLPPVYAELPGLKALFEELQKSPLFARFDWVLTHVYADRPEQLSTPLTRRTIFLYFSNEDFRVPAYLTDLGLLFTPYCWPEIGAANLRALPLGCNGEVPDLPYLPWEERDVDLFYSGHAHKYRKGFYQALQDVLLQFQPGGQELAALAIWSSRFRGGLSPQLYAEYLSRSKVALIPRGHSAITYRLFEAMRAGCLLLCEELPPAWYLEHCPRVILPPDWHNLGAVLQKIWEDPQWMAQMHLQTRENYLQTCTPPALAGYILKELANVASP